MLEAPGNDFESMEKITQTVFGLSSSSSPPTSRQILLQVASNVGLCSEDDAQTAHSQENDALLPHELASLQQWCHLATASVYLEFKGQLCPREHKLFIKMGKLEERFMKQNFYICVSRFTRCER